MAKTIEARAAPARSGLPRSGHHRWRLVSLGVSATLALVIAAGGAYGYGLVVWANDEFNSAALPAEEIADVDTPCDPVCNYLVLGSDTRAGLTKEEQIQFDTVEGQRSDTILLVQIDPEREKAVVLHFPRDLWVQIPGVGLGKINSAFDRGPNLTVRTIERLTGIDINHYVGITLAGFQRVVDALGGVNICVDRPMYDRLAGLDLAAGCHDLDGRQALGFVRARHLEGDCIPDFSRIARQQQFLRAVLSEILSPSTVLRLPSLIRAVVANLPHDRGLELQELVDLTSDLQGLDTGAVEFRAVPGEPGWARDHTVSVVHMKPQARELFRRLREGLPLGSVGKQLPGTQISPANIRVRVIDDGSEGTAEEVRAFLARAGFEALRVSTDVPTDAGGPEILYRVGREDSARAVQRYFPSLEPREVPSSILPRADVAVVVPFGFAVPGEGGAPPPTQPPSDETAPC